MNTEEKLEIARQLVRLGVDVIEAGFPISSPGDFESVRRIGAEVGDAAVVCGLSRAVPKDIEVAADALKTAAAAAHPHRHRRVRQPPARQAAHHAATRRSSARSRRSSSRARFVDDVEFYAEDAGRAEPGVPLPHDRGGHRARARPSSTSPTPPATRIPRSSARSSRGLDGARRRASRTSSISVHCHNDLGMATANALAGVKAGARQVECTINGIGERAGNTAMEEVVMALRQRRDVFGVRHRHQHARDHAHVAARLAASPASSCSRTRRSWARTRSRTRSGIHQDGVLKERSTYEIIDPADVGAGGSAIVLTARSGRHALRHRLEELGYDAARRRVRARPRGVPRRSPTRRRRSSTRTSRRWWARASARCNEVYHLEQVHVTCGEPGIPTATVELVDARRRAPHRLEPRHRSGRRRLQGDQPHRRRAQRADRVQRAGRHARHRRARRGHDPRDRARTGGSSPAEARTPTSSSRRRRRTPTRSTGCSSAGLSIEDEESVVAARRSAKSAKRRSSPRQQARRGACWSSLAQVVDATRARAPDWRGRVAT